ncbi:hypothetical protein M8J75_000401 [Diaphorina citri]|nr:hypothetical protein M8J75_000401 [Diaphorina citri]
MDQSFQDDISGLLGLSGNAVNVTSDDWTTVYNNLLNVGLGVLFVLATLSNSQLVFIFIKRPALRNLNNRFIINLLITNLAACWSILPILYYDTILYDSMERSTNLSVLIACIIEGITAGMCTASVFSVVLIAVDQYFAVLEPLRYHSIIRKRATWQLFCMAWSISLTVGLMGVANNFYRSAYAAVYPILFSFIIFLIPFIAICYIYFCIYWAAHENSLRTRTNCSSSLFNECSNSDLRISHDSILKENKACHKQGDIKFKHKFPRCKCNPYQKPASHESLSKKMKHESKPLLVKDRKCKHNPHKGVKVSKPNELYPITSIEDIDLLMTDKKTPVSPEKKLETLCDEQIVMNIDSKPVTTDEHLECDKVDSPVIPEPVAEPPKHQMFFVTNNNNNNSILKVNNNVKMSSLNRQLISNTIVTSLNSCGTPCILGENKDSTSSLSDHARNQSLASISNQNTSSVISLSQVDDCSLVSSLRNQSIMSLSSYNPSIASSVSDITLSNHYGVSYFIHDDLLSSYFCDKDFLASLNVYKTDDLPQEHEPVTSLKGKDRYVRISLGCYNGIENVQVCNPKPGYVMDENISCDELSCKNSQPLSLRFSQERLDDSSQPLNNPDSPASTSLIGQVVETTNNAMTSKPCDKQLDQNSLHEELPRETCQSNDESCTKPRQTKSSPNLNQIDVDRCNQMSTNTNQTEERYYAVDEKRDPPSKARMFKKNNYTDDRRKQFYENERRKSNDSKCSSDDMEAMSSNCHYYRNMEMFHSPREKTRSIDSVVSRSGVRSFHPSSTRSSLKSTSSTLVNSLKHRFSNASMFKYREESRTAKISLSVIVMALFSWLPFTILLLLHSPLFNVINYTQYSSFKFEKFAILCLSFHFVFSPLLFALRNKKIKRQMIKMWRSWLCFFRKQDEEETRLRNSFYNDYHINKQRIQALKEKQRRESQMKKKNDAETMTSDSELEKRVNQPANLSDVAIQIEQNGKLNNQTASDLEKKITFLSRLFAMKQKCCNSTKAWGNRCLKKTNVTAGDTQRSSISSNTVSTSTTDVCCEV